MDPSNLQKQREPEEPRYLDFQHSKPGSGLNKVGNAYPTSTYTLF